MALKSISDLSIGNAYKEGNDLLFSILFCSGILVAILFIIPMCRGLKKKNKKIRTIGIVGYVFGLLIMISSVIPFPGVYKETGRYTYKCIMEDNVSAKYISDNFNIISVEDDIWTIEDKEK